MATGNTVPTTKQEACAQLRKLIQPGATILVRQVHCFGGRDRMLTFATATGTTIDHLVARILNLPLEAIPGQPGTYACRATDSGEQAGPGFVGALAHKLYRTVFALHCHRE